MPRVMYEHEEVIRYLAQKLYRANEDPCRHTLSFVIPESRLAVETTYYHEAEATAHNLVGIDRRTQKLLRQGRRGKI